MADIQNLEGIVFSPEVKLPTENGVGAVQPIVFSGTTLFYNSKESFPTVGDASLLFVDTNKKQIYKWNETAGVYEPLTISLEQANNYVTLDGAQTITGKKTFGGGIAITKAPENKDMQYYLGIDAFAQGGTVKWINKTDMKVGYASDSDKLDGKDSSYYLDYKNLNNTPNIFNPSDYYWANVKVSTESSNTTFPRFQSMRAGNTVYNLAKFMTSSTPVETVLHTGIKWASSTYMPVIHLTGYAYGLTSPVEFKIGFYVYGDKIGWCGVTNMGAWKPEVYLFKDTRDEVDYVAVGLKGSCYYLMLEADLQENMKNIPSSISLDSQLWYFTYQTASDVAENGSSIPEGGNPPHATCAKVPYKTIRTNVDSANYAADSDKLDGKHASEFLLVADLPSVLIDDTTNRETHPFIGSLEADGHTITVNRQTLKDVGLNTVYRFRGTCTWDELLKKGAVLGDVWNIKKEDDEGNPILDPEGNIGADWVCYNENGVPSSGIEPSQYADYWQSLGGYVDLSNYVEGPTSSTTNALARYEDNSGKRLKNSSATLTDEGKLSVDTLNIRNSNAVSHITLERGGWNYIQAPKTDSIIAFIAGQTGTVAANATLAIDNTAIFPGWTNNVKNIGSSQYKWNNVYAKTYYENDKTLAELYAALDHEHSASNITDLNKILEDYLKKDVVATSTTLGLVKLGSDTKQTIAAQTISSTKDRTYAVQLNNSNQMVVNVPWVDNNDNTWRPIKCGSTTLNDNTTTLEFVAGSNTTLNFTNGKLTITGTGDTKVTNTLNNNVKYYVTGTTSASTTTGTQVFDNKVYVSDVAGALHAITYNIDTNATMKYDSVAQCIRFVIN